MPQERISQLFAPFSQADPASTLKHGGSGLGLNISKKLVEILGGQIWVESVPLRGSIFHFTVSMECPAENPPPLPVPALLHTTRILVVDDHEMTREIIEEILRGLCGTVTSVESGEAALSELLTTNIICNPYHVVFMDWRMPGMDGIETVQAIHRRFAEQTPPLSLPKIIMLTAFGKHTIQQSAEQSQVDLFLHKPVTRVTLFNAILDVLGEETAMKRQPEMTVLHEELDACHKIGGTKILLVEDNYINQQVAMALLQRVGVTVEVANNGLEALEWLTTTPFDAVLMDVQMPEMDGYTTTQHLRNNPRLAKLPIIAMTANVQEGGREACLAAGMDDYVVKPIDIKQLYSVLIRWLNPDDTRQYSGFSAPVITGVACTTTTGLLPPTLAGIDIENALTRLGGEAFLKSMLLRFREHAGIMDLMQAAWQQADWENVRHLAHMMAGIAGNLSATRLCQAAYALEQAIEQDHTRLEPRWLTEFQQALQQVLDAIQTLEPEETAPIMTDPAVGHTKEDPGKIALLLRELSGLLKLRDTDAELTLETLRQIMHRESWPEEMQKLEERIQQLDYPGAQQLLETIQQSLMYSDGRRGT